tara:strand:+ start:45 stop:434 length:390 start_codon:yes stop_codon:yes gene_type:complete
MYAINIMNKFEKAYIYQIKCNLTSDIYIGSSYEPMRIRLSKHLTDLKGWRGIDGNKYRNYRSSFEVLMNDDYEMTKVEDFPCNTKKELLSRESLYIIKARKDDNINIVNKQIPSKITYSEDDLSSLVAF